MDPLFFYIPVINVENTCMDLDKKLGIISCVLRLVIDLFYISFQLRIDHDGNYSFPYTSQKGYIDLLAVLPLPQVVIIIMVSTRKVSKYFDAIKMLNYFVFFQFVPRVIRIYLLFKKATWNFSILAKVAWTKAAFNLYLYMLSGHIFGALWYFYAVAREVQCWKKACRVQTGCNDRSFYCPKSSENYRFVNDFCPTKSQSQNTAFYDFGIYRAVLESGVVEGSFVSKFMYCFRWGLQSLSCFGQNLVTSIDTWENILTIFIIISSVLLFILLIGNMQLYLQSGTTRSEEMKLKLRELEPWLCLKNLSENLQQQVPMFEQMSEQLFDAMCDRLKRVPYTKESYIVQEGDPVDEMIFIIRGLAEVTTNGGRTGFFNYDNLSADDFCGEELLTWALDSRTSSNLPISTRTVRALSEVEAFVLMADDLKFVASQFRLLHTRKIRHTFRFYSQQWRTWAACFIQAAWRRYTKKKIEESLRAAENRLQYALANAGGSSPSLGATIYASRFAVNALGAIRRNSTQKAERVLPILLQKPADPDLSVEEQLSISFE
ncbi:hypothetical protein LWI28_004271 [Acer negundo]|uniref:Cyclic nucleotide-binding domain-containing protein n=1 Tax=Acer negundo TaxID=4023 RepID=A0AAD5IC24_ACENE|nr:hypothetical protein LWI28_004271 [Acer negundo]